MVIAAAEAAVVSEVAEVASAEVAVVISTLVIYP